MGDERREKFLQRGWRVCRALGITLLSLGFLEAFALFYGLVGSGWSWAELPANLRSFNPLVYLFTGYFFFLAANLIKALLEVIDELKTTV